MLLVISTKEELSSLCTWLPDFLSQAANWLHRVAQNQQLSDDKIKTFNIT